MKNNQSVSSVDENKKALKTPKRLNKSRIIKRKASCENKGCSESVEFDNKSGECKRCYSNDIMSSLKGYKRYYDNRETIQLTNQLF